jgi:hypothetical protein
MTGTPFDRLRVTGFNGGVFSLVMQDLVITKGTQGRSGE